MKRFMLKCILLIAVLFIGVLIGMQKANVGMLEMKGYQDKSLTSPINVEETDNGNVEASVLGKDVSSNDLNEKKKQLEEMKAFNFFSSLGKNLAMIVSQITEKIVNLVSSLL